MKKIVSIIILVLALSGIIGGTAYTLTHQGIREETSNKVNKTIEQVTSNVSNNSLTEIYNIYLNNEKHKLKVEYNLEKLEEESSKIKVIIYLDGKTLIEEDSINSNMTSINNVVDTEEFNDIKLEEQNIKILSQEDKDYLLIDLKNNIDSLIEKYYLFDEEGNSFISEGILVYDSSIYYDVLNDTNIFYSDDKQILGKILKNDIYALEYQSDKTNALVEYRYYIKDGTLKREKLNTFKCEIIEEDEEK